jgi:hydrogenase maturation protease
MPPPPASVLVLGLGNDILSDDAIGLRVAQAVRAQLAGHADIEVKETTEMGLTLLDEISGYDGLVLVDAVQTGRAAPGCLHEIEPGALPGVATTSPHFLGVGETLALGRTLGLPMPRQVRIVAVEVADPFTLGTDLTPAVAAAVAAATERVATVARIMAEAQNKALEQ